MKTVYMAAPVAPFEGETIEGNLQRARDTYRRLQLEFRDTYCILAPWILTCESFDESFREDGMRWNCHVIGLCDELWLTGSRVSPGMAREVEMARAKGIPVIDKLEP